MLDPDQHTGVELPYSDKYQSAPDPYLRIQSKIYSPPEAFTRPP